MCKTRIELLDFIRGANIFVVLFYHFVYDLAMFGLVSWDFVFCTPMIVLERVSAGLFVLLAGFSSKLSRNNLRRGAEVFACGLIVALVSQFAGITIRFGVLELLGASMMLYAVVEKYIGNRGALIPTTCLPLFVGTYYMYRNLRIGTNLLYPLGLRSESFFSADYFPLMPWFFLFLIGTWLAENLLKDEQAWQSIKCPSIICKIGRKTLIIYMAHQIVLYPLAWLVSCLPF